MKASQSKLYAKKTTAVDLTHTQAHIQQVEDTYAHTHTHTIKSAAQRMQEATLKSAQNNKPKPPTPSNAHTHAHTDILSSSVGGMVHIKVRVNGKLESIHNMGVGDKFAQLASMVYTHYNLPHTTKLSMEVDGEGVGMETTPSALDMEEDEDYLVDIKVDAKTFELMKANKSK
ncbi:hypothetical protein EON63_07265 [archaeon]|nr:MAG: hypothetical protein EON63_07265 [archaeon]